MFYVYIIKCYDKTYYVGQTNDLVRRIAQHNTGEIAGFTAERFPVTLMCYRTFETRDDAVAFEKKAKGWSRAKKEAFIVGDEEAFKALSLKKNFYRPVQTKNQSKIKKTFPRDKCKVTSLS